MLYLLPIIQKVWWHSCKSRKTFQMWTCKKGKGESKTEKPSADRQLLSRLVWVQGPEWVQNWTARVFKARTCKVLLKIGLLVSSQKWLGSFRALHSSWDPASIEVKGALPWLSWGLVYAHMLVLKVMQKIGRNNVPGHSIRPLSAVKSFDLFCFPLKSHHLIKPGAWVFFSFCFS